MPIKIGLLLVALATASAASVATIDSDDPRVLDTDMSKLNEFLQAEKENQIGVVRAASLRSFPATRPSALSRPVSPRRGNETYLSFLLRRRTRNTARALEVRVCTNQSLSRSLWPLRWIAVQEHVTRELKTRLAKELESALNRRV